MSKERPCVLVRRSGHGEAIVAMMAMITKMAKNEPKTNSIFFWPFFWGGSDRALAYGKSRTGPPRRFRPG
ncbi:hypothetical protein SALBM311S_13100 [Streptomyces alboniger]